MCKSGTLHQPGWKPITANCRRLPTTIPRSLQERGVNGRGPSWTQGCLDLAKKGQASRRIEVVQKIHHQHQVIGSSKIDGACIAGQPVDLIRNAGLASMLGGNRQNGRPVLCHQRQLGMAFYGVMSMGDLHSPVPERARVRGAVSQVRERPTWPRAIAEAKLPWAKLTQAGLSGSSSPSRARIVRPSLMAWGSLANASW